MSLFKRIGGDDYPSHVKVLLSGDPKSGKTSFLGTVPNIVVLDTEPHANNMQSIAHLGIPAATITSSTELMQAQVQLSDTTLRGMLAQSLGMEKIEAVSIDTLDTLQAILKRERMREQKTTQFLRDDWGWLKEEMTKVIESFTALPLHVFFTVHTKTNQLGNPEKGDGRTIVLPGLEGSIAEKIAGMVGYSLMTFRTQEIDPTGKSKTSYFLRAEGDNTYGFLGNRAAGELPDIIDPKFSTLLHYATLARRKAQEGSQQVSAAAPAKGPAPEVAATTAQAPTSAPQNVVQSSDQKQQAPVTPAPAAAPLAADDEKVNAAALSHVKRVYDALGITFPEELVRSKTMGEARNVVKFWKAVQEDQAQGKSTDPKKEMTEYLGAVGFLPAEGAAAVQAPEPVQPKIDGTIEQVIAYVGEDLAKAQEAYDLESSKEKPRAGLISKLEGLGAKPKPTSTPESEVQVQTPVENNTAGQEAAPVTPVAENADAAPTEEKGSVETLAEALDATVVSEEDNAEAPCEKCGNPVDDLDIAQLSRTRFGQWLCVTDYIAATKS